MANNQKVTIAELNISTDKLVKNLDNLESHISSLVEKHKLLESQGEQNTQQFKDNEAQIKSMLGSYKEQVAVLDAVNQAHAKVSDTVVDGISHAGDYTAKQKELIAAMSQTKMEMELTAEAMKELQAAGEGSSNEFTQLELKMDSLKETLSETKESYDKVTEAEKLRTMSASELKGELMDSLGITQAYEKAQKAYAIAQNLVNVAVGGGSKALKIFKVALASTGIGLILVALGSMVAYLSSTQEGINMVNSVLTPLKVVFQALFGVVQDTGKALVEAFSSPKKLLTDLYNFIKGSIMDQFKGIALIMEGIAERDFSKVKQGIKDVANASPFVKMGKAAADAFDEVGDKMSEAYKRGEDIARITRELSASEADLIIKKSELNAIFEEQKKISDDVNLSEAERIEAAKKAEQAQKDIRKLMEDRLDQEILLLQLKQQQNDTSDAEKVDLANLIAERNKLREEEASKTTETQNKINSITKEGADKRKAAAEKAAQERIKLMEDELAIFIAEQGFRKKSSEDQLAFELTQISRKKAILAQQLKDRIITEKEHKAALLELENEQGALMANAAVENAGLELEAWRKANMQRLDEEKLLTDSQLAERQRLFDEQLVKEREYHATRLKEGVINEQEYNEAINTLNEENRTNKEAAEAERKQIAMEQRALELENEILAAEDEFERQRIILDNDYALKIAAAEKLGVDTTEIQKKHAQAQADIEFAKNQAVAGQYADLFGGIAKLLGEHTAAGKAAAIAETTMNTYAGIAQVWKSESILPEPFATAAKVVSTGVVLASGLGAVQKITATPTPTVQSAPEPTIRNRYALGGILKGKRHYEGGIPTPFGELESGEAVMTRKATSMFGPLLSELNVIGGGRRFANGGILDSRENRLWRQLGVGAPMQFENRRFADGGILGVSGVSGKSQIIDYNLLAQSVGNLPPAVVSVEEFSKVQTRLQVIEQGGVL